MRDDDLRHDADRDPRREKSRERRLPYDAKGSCRARGRLKTSDHRRQRRAADEALHRALADHGDGDLVDFDVIERRVERKSYPADSRPIAEWLDQRRWRRAWSSADRYLVGGYDPESDRERFERYVRQLMESRSEGTVDIARLLATVLGRLPLERRVRIWVGRGEAALEKFFDDVPSLWPPFERWLEAQLALGEARDERLARRGR